MIKNDENNSSGGTIAHGEVIIAGNGFLTRNQNYKKDHCNMREVFPQPHMKENLPDEAFYIERDHLLHSPNTLSQGAVRESCREARNCITKESIPNENQCDEEYRKLLEKRKNLSVGEGKRYFEDNFSVTETLSKVLNHLRSESDEENFGAGSLADSDILVDSPFDSGLEGSEDELDVFIANEARLYKEAKLYREIETEIVETVSIIERIGSRSSWHTDRRKSVVVIGGGDRPRYVIEIAYKPSVVTEQGYPSPQREAPLKVAEVCKAGPAMKKPACTKQINENIKERISKSASAKSFSGRLRNSLRRKRNKMSHSVEVPGSQESQTRSAKRRASFKWWLLSHKEKKVSLTEECDCTAATPSVCKMDGMSERNEAEDKERPFAERGVELETCNATKSTQSWIASGKQERKKSISKIWRVLPIFRKKHKKMDAGPESSMRLAGSDEFEILHEHKDEPQTSTSLPVLDRHSVYVPLPEDMDLSSLLDFANIMFEESIIGETGLVRNDCTEDTAENNLVNYKEKGSSNTYRCEIFSLEDNLRESLHLRESSETLSNIACVSNVPVGEPVRMVIRTGSSIESGCGVASQSGSDGQSDCGGESLHLWEDSGDDAILIVEQESCEIKVDPDKQVEHLPDVRYTDL